MATKINYNVYGTKDEWVSCYDDSCKIKLATFTQSSEYPFPFNSCIATGKKLGKLTDNIDKSICPIACDKNASIVNCKFVGFDEDDEVLSEYENTATQSALMYCSVPDNASHNYTCAADFVNIVNGINARWNSDNKGKFGNFDDYPLVMTSFTQPVADFDYKKIVFCIFVWASDNADTLTGTTKVRLFDLKTYAEHAYVTYKYVLSVFVSAKYLNSNNFFTNFGSEYIYNYNTTTRRASFSVIPVESCKFTAQGVQAKYIYHNNLLATSYSAQIWYNNHYNSVSNAVAGAGVVVGGYKNYYANLINKKKQYIQIVGKDMFNAKADSSNKHRIFAVCEIDSETKVEEFKEWTLKQVAYLGMFYTTDYKSFDKYTPDFYIKDTTYLGLIDDNGITHGEYAHGDDIKNYPQSKWVSLKDESNYDYSKKDQSERKSDPYAYNFNVDTAFAGANYYAMSKGGIELLQKWMSDVVYPAGPFTTKSDPPDGYYSYEDLAYQLQTRFNGSYPENQIVSLMYYPFPINSGNMPNTTFDYENIKLGNAYTSGADNWYGTKVLQTSGNKLGNSNILEMSTQDYDVTEYYSDFRDFSPYTSMLLVVPYHGTLHLDPGTWYGHTLSTKMVVDVVTGASTVYIERDHVPIDTLQGQVGMPIQLVLRNSGESITSRIANCQALNQQKFDNVRVAAKSISTTAQDLGIVIASTMTNQPMLIAAAAGKAMGGALNTAANISAAKETYDNIKFAVEHAPADSTVVSQASPSVAQTAEPFLRLLIYYPKMLPDFDANVYGKTVGFACNIQGKIGNFKGFTVFASANLDGLSCNEDVKHSIFRKLQAGIII